MNGRSNRFSFCVLRFDPHNPIHADKKEAFESAYGVIVNSNFYGGYSGGLDDESDRVQVFRLGEPTPLESDRVPTYLQDEVAYSVTAPWPELKKDESLHRSSPDDWGSAPESWSAGKPTPVTFLPKRLSPNGLHPA